MILYINGIPNLEIVYVLACRFLSRKKKTSALLHACSRHLHLARMTSYSLSHVVPLVLLIALISNTQAFRTGFTLDLCRTDDNCRPPRRCVFPTGGTLLPCFDDFPLCVCGNTLQIVCATSEDCQFGEVCTNRTGRKAPFCISCRAARNPELAEIYTVVDNFTLCPPVLSNGASGVFCNSSMECNPPRRCVSRIPGGLCGSVGQGSQCECTPPTRTDCTTCTKCDAGERCFWRERDSNSFCASVDAAKNNSAYKLREDGICTPSPSISPLVKSSPTPSPSAVPSRTPSSSPSLTPSISVSGSPPNDVCIDSDALRNVPMHERVFRKDIISVVLCDMYRSCATEGHIVTVHGRAMTMRGYCSTPKVQCTRETKLVNSPRMGRRVRVVSNTEGVEFTAFSARYGTWAEEAVARLMVLLGW